MHNQLEAAKIDNELRNLTKKMKDLTEDTVDDSATVKIITFVSAVYLPGNFIAVSLARSSSVLSSLKNSHLLCLQTLFGMNFFLFNPTSKALEISPDFWIFIATWLPLIFITGAVYVFILFVDSKMKGKPFRFPWRKRSDDNSLDVQRKDES